MRALTCAFLTLGLVLATCAGCDSGTPAKRPSVSTPSASPDGGAGEMAPETEPIAPSTPTETPATEGRKEGAEETATEEPAVQKPAEEKKTDESPAAEKASDDKKSEDK